MRGAAPGEQVLTLYPQAGLGLEPRTEPGPQVDRDGSRFRWATRPLRGGCAASSHRDACSNPALQIPRMDREKGSFQNSSVGVVKEAA